ncbi:MAG: ATP-binding protein [Methylomonas sp.]|nr:ATP-binding protein [Methylomonas sp.]
MFSDDDEKSDILVIESGKPAILVVDGDTGLATRLNELFNKAAVVDSSVIRDNSPYVIIGVTTAAAAVQAVAGSLAHHGQFNLIFSEYQLDQGNGLELIQRLWQLDPNLNAILCTGYPRLDWQQIVETLGESDQLLILQKPFSEVELRQIVHAMIRQWQLVKQTQSVMQFFELQNKELDAANRKLQDIQAQLLQSEKMSSIGQLAAGVAHEINNPIGFIKSNLNSLKGYTEDFLALIAAYEQAEANIVCSETLYALHRLKEKIELDYLRKDALELLCESSEGIERVKKIVQDLKDFSYPEKNADRWQWADLHVGLESTLNIVYNEVKYKAEVVKEYGELPPINCLQSQLNQVFVNLLVNAAQAIADHGVITIRTGAENDKVWIEIQDSGCGIAEDKLSKVFDPFYTTKPVGKGTGLGLAISYGIVKKHKGEITVSSKIGQGTTFRVLLPVDPEEQSS